MRVIFIDGRRKDDADNVVAVGRARQAEHAPVGSRGARDLALLAQVYVRLGRGEAVGGARLDFDEADDGAVVRDEVNLGLHDRAAPVAADAELEVRRDESVSVREKVLGRQRFAAPPEFEVRRESLIDGGATRHARARRVEEPPCRVEQTHRGAGYRRRAFNARLFYPAAAAS